MLFLLLLFNKNTKERKKDNNFLINVRKWIWKYWYRFTCRIRTLLLNWQAVDVCTRCLLKLKFRGTSWLSPSFQQHVWKIYTRSYTRGSKWTSCDIIKAISDRARCYRYSMGSSFTEERLFKTTSKNVVEREDWIEKIFTHRIVETSIELFIQNCNTWHDKLKNIGLRKLRWYKFDRKKFDYIWIYSSN